MARFVVSLGAFCAAIVISSSAFAQIIYEPVRYQYGEQQKYYYGGSDPLVHYFAQQPVGGAGRWGRVNGWAFASGDIHTHREVACEPVRAYTDALPYINARWFGFTPTDARNEAYFNATRYFRKGDLLNAGIRMPDGSVVVPADARPIVVTENGGLYIGRSRARQSPKPVMIIPKDRLQRPQQKQPSDKSFVSASAQR